MKKKHLLPMLFLGACVSLAAFAVRAQVTIMPFGDSITTYGASPESSYRYWLYSDLTNAGYEFVQNGGDLEFVGTSSGVENGSPAISWPYEEFSGHEGQTTANALGDSGAYTINPNIILLEFGQNDIPAGFSPGETETNIENIIQDLAINDPGVVILLADPTGFLVNSTLYPGTTKQQQQQLRSAQSKLVSAVNKAGKVEKKAGINVIMVNLFNGYNTRTDTLDDGDHPNVRGEQEIARKFFNALKPVLKKMGVDPVPKRDR